MPPVRRHRIGDQMPVVSHAGPDPAAIALCRDLVSEVDVECAILFGSRARGGWDEQSDLDLIVIHQRAGDVEEGRSIVGQALGRLREFHYPGYLEYESPHHGVVDGLMVETPEDYRAHRRTLNHVMARDAREGLVFCKGPGTEYRYRHDGDVSNEWELVTRERLRRAASAHRDMELLRGHAPWYAEGDPPAGRHRINVHTSQGRDTYRLLWNSGAALLSILGAVYPPGLGGGDGPVHRRARRRLEARFPERSGPHRPVLRLRVQGGRNGSHRRCASHVAGPGGGPGCAVGTDPRTQRL